MLNIDTLRLILINTTEGTSMLSCFEDAVKDRIRAWEEIIEAFSDNISLLEAPIDMSEEEYETLFRNPITIALLQSYLRTEVSELTVLEDKLKRLPTFQQFETLL